MLLSCNMATSHRLAIPCTYLMRHKHPHVYTCTANTVSFPDQQLSFILLEPPHLLLLFLHRGRLQSQHFEHLPVPLDLQRCLHLLPLALGHTILLPQCCIHLLLYGLRKGGGGEWRGSGGVSVCVCVCEWGRAVESGNIHVTLTLHVQCICTCTCTCMYTYLLIKNKNKKISECVADTICPLLTLLPSVCVLLLHPQLVGSLPTHLILVPLAQHRTQLLTLAPVVGGGY